MRIEVSKTKPFVIWNIFGLIAIFSALVISDLIILQSSLRQAWPELSLSSYAIFFIVYLFVMAIIWQNFCQTSSIFISLENNRLDGPRTFTIKSTLNHIDLKREYKIVELFNKFSFSLYYVIQGKNKVCISSVLISNNKVKKLMKSIKQNGVT